MTGAMRRRPLHRRNGRNLAREPEGAFARYSLMGALFSQPNRYAPDPPGLILSAAEAARQASLRAALPPPRRSAR